MTKKAKKDTSKGKRAKPRLNKETVKDLEAGKGGEAVKGGVGKTQNNAYC